MISCFPLGATVPVMDAHTDVMLELTNLVRLTTKQTFNTNAHPDPSYREVSVSTCIGFSDCRRVISKLRQILHVHAKTTSTNT